MFLGEKAEQLFRGSLAVPEKELDPTHAEVLDNLSSLAATYKAERKLADAGGCYERIVAAKESTLGADSLELVDSLMADAEVLKEQHLDGDARPIEERVKAIRARGTLVAR